MQFMLSFFTPADPKRDADPVASQAHMGAWMAYMGAMRAAGIIVNGDGLQPPHTATTVRVRDGQRSVQDGPFTNTKEHLGGYFIIDVPSQDDALMWAARSPAASLGAVEVRPVMVVPAQAAKA